MLADLHLSDDFTAVNFDTFIAELKSVYCINVSKQASRIQFDFIVQQEN